MTQSQKFLQLQKILTQSPLIKDLLQNVAATTAQYTNLGISSTISHHHLHQLALRLNSLRIPEINLALSHMKIPHAIVAFPIQIVPNFTLFFVVVPGGKRFDWHSHPRMGGVSKCFHGHLDISTIDINQMQPFSFNTCLYPKNKIRFQSLKAECEETVAIIDPEVYNVHKIEAKQLSAFFDLLMPDYPENTCQFFRTIDQNEENMLLQRAESEGEEIVGWDVYYEQLLKGEKHIVKTYILK